MPTADEPQASSASRQVAGFGLTTATFVVVSSMVGVGILTTSGYVMVELGSNSLMLVLWGIGGVLALCGALTLAELATALPRSGGEYVFLREAYGPLAGFVAGWVSFLLGFAAPVAASASAASSYLLEPFETPDWAVRGLATLAIALFAAIQATGRRQTAGLQGLASGLTLVLMGLFVAAGLLGRGERWGHFGDWPAPSADSVAAAISSLVFISYAYTGWNGAAYIAGEVREPRRTLPRAILLGTGLVLVLYLALNVVYGLGHRAGDIRELARLRGEDAVEPIAALTARRLWGDGISSALSIAFGLVLLASLSALILSGSRVLVAMAEDDLFPRFAARKAGGDGTPKRAIGLLAATALLMLWTGSFRDLVVFSSVGLALFSMAAISTVFVLRARRPDLDRPFRTPGYPAVPAVYLLGSGLLVLVVLLDKERGRPAWWSIAGILAGVPVYGLVRLVARPRR